MEKWIDYKLMETDHIPMGKRRKTFPITSLQDSRKKRRYSQQELSRRTSIAQGDISKIETGKSNPSVLTLKRLAEGLDCDLRIEFIPKEERFSYHRLFHS